MDSNGVDLEPSPPPRGPIEHVDRTRMPADALPPSLRASAWLGARAGFRRASYVTMPIAAVIVILGLALTAFGLGAGRGLGAPPMLAWAFAFASVSELCAGLLGATIGTIGALIRRAHPGTVRAFLWATLNRPIRVRPVKRIAAEPVEAAPPRRRRRWTWLVGVPAALVLAVAFGAGVYLGRMVDRRLDEAIAAADRDDPAWRLDDLMAGREAVPDAENSALVVAGVLSTLPESWPSGPPPQPGEPKPPPTPAMGAYDRMTATADNIRLDDATTGTLRGELDEYQEAVRIARTVADYRRGRHELEIGTSILNTFLPETQAARTAARLLAVDAAIRADVGDIDGALDSCRAILGVARSIGDEPFLISQLVRIAIGEVAMKSTRRALAQGEPSDSALARLQALILDELAQPLLLVALKGERASLVEVIRRVGAGELPISALSNSPKADPNRPPNGIAPWGKLMFDNQRAAALEWMNEAVAIARLPSPTRPPRWKAWEVESLRVKRSWHGYFSSTLPLLMSPAVVASGMAHSRHLSSLGATAILLAAERHRRKVGDWPASVASIDPTILPNPPADPFSGGAFRLERRDGQLLIYSIGPDGKDDHGAFEPKRWLNGGPDDVGTGGWDVPHRRQSPGP